MVRDSKANQHVVSQKKTHDHNKHSISYYSTSINKRHTYPHLKLNS